MEGKKGFFANLFGGNASGGCECGGVCETRNDKENVVDDKKPAGSCCVAGEECCIDSIKVLGAGCKSCHEQYINVETALQTMGISVETQYITDMEIVISYGAMSMPAIVVNEKIVSMGKVLKAAEVEKLLHKLGY